MCAVAGMLRFGISPAADSEQHKRQLESLHDMFDMLRQKTERA